jgi:hypothetical protein
MTKETPFRIPSKALILLGVFVIWAPASVGAHDPYTGIFNFSGVNCCTGHDCLQAADPNDFEPVTNGYKVRSTGEVVPMSTTGFSPDANWHVCRKSDVKKTIRCLLVPAGGA